MALSVPIILRPRVRYPTEHHIYDLLLYGIVYIFANELGKGLAHILKMDGGPMAS